jgi:phage tail-like protein
MARSTISDPLEKWRFTLTVLNISASPAALIQDLTATAFLRAGFKSIKLPKKSTKKLFYRESGDPEQMRIQPGLTSYSDCVCTRGSTENEDFYRWSILVKGDSQFQSIMAEVGGQLGVNQQQAPVANAQDYRKDIIINNIDRNGRIRKSWHLFNCWITDFDPGDLDAHAEEQLIESMVICCETMAEVSADQAEANRITLMEVGSATLNQLVPGLGSELLGGF